MDVYYDEGIFVGYRWYDHAGVAPLYPFGHGLSYTTFAWTDLRTSVRRGRLRVSLSVENTGDRSGKETVQVYVGAPAAGEGASYERPLQELKAFRKVSLGPGESQRVHVEIPLPELGYYDSAQARFVTVHGTYVVRVGASSRDIRLEKQIEL